jgi:hypothetical protein
MHFIKIKFMLVFLKDITIFLHFLGDKRGNY